MPKLHIIAISNESALGHKQNTMLTASQLIKTAATAGSSVDFVNATDTIALTAAMDKNKADPTAQLVVIGAGPEALPVLLQLKKQVPNGYFYFSNHQYERALFAYLSAGAVDHIGIPGSTATSDQLNELGIVAKVTELFAVPAALNVDDLRAKYEQWDLADKPRIETPSLVVMLGGDAPDEQGNFRYFSATEAAKMATAVKAYAAASGITEILVTNGPRTGLYDPNSAKEAHQHVYKAGAEKPALDVATKQFVTTLDMPHRLWDFNFRLESNGSKTPESVYHPLVYLALSNPNSRFIMPGESVTGLGELAMAFTPKQAIVWQHAGMNASHARLVAEGFQRGYFGILEPSGQLHTPTTNKSSPPLDQVVAAQAILEAIIARSKPGNPEQAAAAPSTVSEKGL